MGLSYIKKQIHKKIILPFQKPSLFQRFKKKIGGGVLLYGPPGCGKTLLARATAGECKASFYNVEISDILDMYIGESEQKLHAIFEKARAETPCVLFFDEFEAMAGKRESNRNSSFNNIVSQFLTELDGFSQNNSGVLVLASTNVPWSIDSAFLRPGRFDRMFFVPPPDVQARQGILEQHMIDRPSQDNINYSTLAVKCKGYSGADLYNLVEMAADEAIDESIESEKDILIDARHFKEALNTANPTTIEWLTTARNYARYANDGGRYNEVLKFIQKHGK
ncbi:MAG: ATP-binding protein [Proteobacteria bacterium]|nr:ATP-binding protein [Pseudomonadota bacterium]